MPGHGDEFMLRSLDFMGDEKELRTAALAELNATDKRNHRAPQYEHGSDSTGAVQVSVDQKGSVVDVHIRSDWRTDLRPQALGSALIEACEVATTAMMNALALASLAKEEHTGVDGERRAPTPQPVAPERDMREIWQILSNVEDEMHRVEKMLRQRGAGSRTIYSTTGIFKGTCEGRMLSSISAEVTLVDQSDTEQLRSAALDLFRQADDVTGRDDS